MGIELLKNSNIRISNESLTEKVYSFLENSILEMRFRPGEQLNEEEIANALKVSRSPVREALLRLERAGLVNKSNKFRTVSTITRESVSDFYNVWNMTETYGAKLACMKATPDDRNKLEATLVRMEDYKNQNNISGYREENDQFHRLVVKPCPIPTIIEYHGIALNHVKWCYNYTLMDAENVNTSRDEHVGIFKAYKSKDVTTLEKLIGMHIMDALARMLNYYEHLSR